MERAEKELQESKERLKAIINNAPNVAIQGYNIDGRVLFWNKAAEGIFGYTEEEAFGKTLDQLMLDKDRACEFQAILRAIDKSNKPFGPSEWECKNKKGEKVTVYSTIFPISLRDGKNEFICMDVDITEFKETAREKENFLRNIFNSIQDGISILDKDLNIISVNHTMEKWYAHNMPLIGKKCYMAYQCRNSPCEVCPSYRTIRSGKPDYEVVPFVGIDGAKGWLDLFTFPVFDTKTNQLTSIIEYVRDITERKKLEEEIKQRLKELEEFYDMAIGRELKMKELKEEIERLKEELRKYKP